MEYKIIAVHIKLLEEEALRHRVYPTYVVAVAIQSDPKEETASHFKAYQSTIISELDTSAFRNIAATGIKLSERNAKRIFPELENLGYY